MQFFSRLIASEKTTVNQTYLDALAADKDLGQTRGIDATLKPFDLDAFILPTSEAFKPAAIAGYPVITGKTFSLLPGYAFSTLTFVVPLGFLPESTSLSPAKPTRSSGPNQPFGIAFMGSAFSENKLIAYAFAYEQATHARLKQLAYAEAIPKTQIFDVIKG